MLAPWWRIRTPSGPGFPEPTNPFNDLLSGSSLSGSNVESEILLRDSDNAEFQTYRVDLLLVCCKYSAYSIYYGYNVEYLGINPIRVQSVIVGVYLNLAHSVPGPSPSQSRSPFLRCIF